MLTAATPRRAANVSDVMAKNVKIYSAPWCPWCRREKEWLKSKGVTFEEIDVDADRKAAEDMIRKSGQTGIPVTDIEGEIIVGFDRPRLAKLLGISE